MGDVLQRAGERPRLRDHGVRHGRGRGGDGQWGWGVAGGGACGEGMRGVGGHLQPGSKVVDHAKSPNTAKHNVWRLGMVDYLATRVYLDLHVR